MAIKTFVLDGDKWSQVVGANINAASANTSWDPNCGMTTWDPSKINWTDYTTAPVPMDITWTGTDPWYVGTPAAPLNPNDIYGGPLGGQSIGCPGNNNQFINSDFNWMFPQIAMFTKPAGVRPDVLMGFFSQYIHALMFIADGQTHVMPFMERLGMIWIQHELNKWTAYDRKEFYAFIDNPDATTFVGTTLNKREVQRTMSEAKDE